MTVEPPAGPMAPAATGDARERVLSTAADLFYRLGVRAVGVDLIIERAGVAKTSLYRHFKTKDELIAAFLQREDEDFWGQWDRAAGGHEADARAELDAHLSWIGERIARPHYRGCPQLNVAAEFPDADHPARRVAAAHKSELRHRLQGLAERLGVRHPRDLGAQLAVLINGGFVSGQMLAPAEAARVLKGAAAALVAAG
jgi:AcrR family transcriptional regulator